VPVVITSVAREVGFRVQLDGWGGHDEEGSDAEGVQVAHAVGHGADELAHEGLVFISGKVALLHQREAGPGHADKLTASAF
jgi:hypothetical protein